VEIKNKWFNHGSEPRIVKITAVIQIQYLYFIMFFPVQNYMELSLVTVLGFMSYLIKQAIQQGSDEEFYSFSDGYQ